MGKIKRGILGGFSGKVANVVGTSWKGIAVMKSLPLSVANPRTALQIANRTRNSKVLLLGQGLGIAAIRALNNRWAMGMSGFNAFMQNSKDCFRSNGTFNYQNLVLSKGSLGLMFLTDFSFSNSQQNQTVTINWSTLTNRDVFANNDKVCVGLIDSDGNVLFSVDSTKTVVDGSLTFSGILMEASTPYYFVISVLKADGFSVSDSIVVSYEI